MFISSKYLNKTKDWAIVHEHELLVFTVLNKKSFNDLKSWLIDHDIKTKNGPSGLVTPGLVVAPALA